MKSTPKKLGDRSLESDAEAESGLGSWNHRVVRPSNPPRPGTSPFAEPGNLNGPQTAVAVPRAKVQGKVGEVLSSQGRSESDQVSDEVSQRVFSLVDHLEMLIPITTFSMSGFLRTKSGERSSLVPTGASTLLREEVRANSDHTRWVAQVETAHRYALAGAIIEGINFVATESPALPRQALVKEILSHISPEYRFAARSLMNSALDGQSQLLAMQEKDRIEYVIEKIFEENQADPSVPLFNDIPCSAPGLATRTFLEKVRTLPAQNQIEQNVPIDVAVDFAIHKMKVALAIEPDEKGRVQTFFSTLMLLASQPESFFIGIKREQHMQALAIFSDAIQPLILNFKKNNIVVGKHEKSLDEFIQNFFSEMLQAFEQTAFSSTRSVAGRGISGSLHQETLKPFFEQSGIADITRGAFKLKPAVLNFAVPVDRLSQLEPGHPRTSTAQAFHAVKKDIDLTPGSWDVDHVKSLLNEHLQGFNSEDVDGKPTSIVDVSFHMKALRDAIQSYTEESQLKLVPQAASFAQLARSLDDALADFDTGMNASLSMLKLRMLDLPQSINARIAGKSESSPLPLLGALMIAEEVEAKCESYRMLIVLFERVKSALINTIDYQFDEKMVRSLNTLLELEKHLHAVSREIRDLSVKSEITFGDNLRLSSLKRFIDDQSESGVFAENIKEAVASLVSCVEYAHATLIASSPTSGAQPVPQPMPLRMPQLIRVAPLPPVDVEIEPVDEEATVESPIAVASPMTNVQPVSVMNESTVNAAHTEPSRPDSNAKYSGMGRAITLAAATGAAAGMLAYLYYRTTKENPDDSVATSVAQKHTQGTGTESDGSAQTQVTFEHFDYEVALAPFLPSEEVQYLDESDGIPYLDEDAVIAVSESDEVDSHKLRNDQLRLSGNLAKNITRGITLKLSGVFGRAREKFEEIEGIHFRSSDERVDSQPKQRLMQERSLNLQVAARKFINIGVLGAYLAGTLGGTEKNVQVDSRDLKATASTQSAAHGHESVSQKGQSIEDHTEVLSEMSEKLFDGTLQAPLADFSLGNTGARAFTSAVHGPLVNNAVDVKNAQFNNESLVLVTVAKNEGFTQATDRTIGELALENYLLAHDEIDTPEQKKAAQKAMKSVVGDIKPAEALGLFTAGLATDHPVNHKLFDALDKNRDGTLKLDGNVNLVARPSRANESSGFVLNAEAAPIKSRIVDLSKKIEEKLAQNMERDHKSQKNQSMFGSIFKSVKSFVKKFA